MKSPQRGFTLVEIMVAMVIGMIGILVIMQVARTSEAQKRMTVGSGSAQNSGAMGIYMIQRDVKQAGYGFTSPGALGCPLTIPAESPLSARNLAFLVPVVINSEDVPAGDAGTDTLLVAYGSSAGSPEGDTIIPPSVGEKISVMSTTNFKEGERVVVAPVTPTDGCELTLGTITEAPVTGSFTVTVSDISVALDPSGFISVLLDLGPRPRVAGYAIRNGDLTTCDYMRADCGDAASVAANWPVIANGVVSLRAQYGRDATPLDGSVDTWDQDTPELTGTQEQFASAWARIAAVRLALVARNSEPAGVECVGDSTKSKCPTTPQNVPLWAGSPADPEDPVEGEAGIDLSAANSDWQHYRYQVYEAVIPLRNIPWMGVL
jgi:type IV pilus assembly protein PilW